MESERVYVVSRASVPERPAMWRRLRNVGCNIVSTWIDEAGPGETASMSDLWTRVRSEVASADRVALYVEAGDFPLKGALVEVGIALGLHIPVYVCAQFEIGKDWRPIGSWAAYPLVTLCGDVFSAVGAFKCSKCGSPYLCGHKLSAEARA